MQGMLFGTAAATAVMVAAAAPASAMAGAWAADAALQAASTSSPPLLSLQDRQVGALVGGLLADAAVMPLHWIYNQTDLRTLGGTEPEFHDPPHCHDDRVPTHCDYDYPLGENSPYGQQMRVYLKLFAEHGTKPGAVDAAALVEANFAYYGAPTGACANISTGVNSTGCYWDKSTKEFVANVRANKTCAADNTCGGDDNQADALAHQVITSVLGSSTAATSLRDVLSDAGTVVTVTQNNEQAVAFGMAGARIIQAALSGSVATPRAAVRATLDALLDPNRVLPNIEDFLLATGLQFVINELANVSSAAVALQVGQSCDYPNNLLTGAHMLYQIGGGVGGGKSGQNHNDNATATYVDAIRQLILAGGDQASRSMFVGTVLGAVAGVDGLPQSWKDKYSHYDEVLALAEKAVAAVRARRGAVS